VGDHDYCVAFALATGNRACYRVVDNLDIVTHVPPATLNVRVIPPVVHFVHPNVAVFWLDPTHALQINPQAPPTDDDVLGPLPWRFVTIHWMQGLSASLPRTLADHSPVRYCQYLGLAIQLGRLA
jgi:hypothetical protein